MKNKSILMLDIFYQTAGSPNNRPLIFLHGWGARAEDTCGRGRRSVTAKLSEHFFVYSVELPGLIRSEPPHEVWDMEEYAKTIRSFIKLLGIDRPIIMGQSFGGGVATTYAGLYPDDVPYLVLVDASPGKRTPNFYYNLRFKWKPFFDWVVDSRIMPLSFRRAVVSLYLGVPQDRMTNKNIQKYKIMSDVETSYSIKTDYSSLPMPVLLVWGEKDIYVTPLQRAKEIALEIAMQGTQGYRPDKDNYRINSINNKTFSGYHILAYYYVSWALAMPDEVNKLGLDYDKEFEMALLMNKQNK